LEVVAKDLESNSLIVEPKGTQQTHSIPLHDLRFVSWEPQEGQPIPFECRTRSLSARQKGTLVRSGAKGVFQFENVQGPLSPGQSLVLYRGQEVVGGGVMK
jgi:tRNA-specific 2-thiouridylase